MLRSVFQIFTVFLLFSWFFSTCITGDADPEFRCSGTVQCHIVGCSTRSELQTRICHIWVETSSYRHQNLHVTRTYTMIVFKAIVDKKTEK